MQMSGTFPQLSDRVKKTIKKPVATKNDRPTPGDTPDLTSRGMSAAGRQKGGALAAKPGRHTGSLAGNRARAHQRAGRKG